jgi:acyl-homoserine-lactone acylase
MRRLLIEPLRGWVPEDPDTRRAAELLLAWDGLFEEESHGAAVAVTAWRELDVNGHLPEPPFEARAAVTFAASFLKEHHGSVEVPLGQIQRLVHGEVDLPLGGGPDTLNCTYHEIEGGRLVGDQGDSYVMVAEFPGRAWSIHQYGASLRPESPHYSDQAPLFVARKLKPVLRTREEIRAFLEAEYHPGERWTPSAAGSPEERLAEAEALWD